MFMTLENKKFDPRKLEKLNNNDRLKHIPPEILASEIYIKNPTVLIDLGAGTGLFSKAFSKIYSGCEIFACDISPIMVNWMEDNLAEFPSIHPILTEEKHVPLDNSTADIIVMINLYHELENPIATLNECQRLLRKDGVVVISDWKKENMVNGPSFNYRIDKTEVKKHLEITGFSNIRIIDNLEFNYLILANK
jgi:ubiquinone/menaquinone biosynthesis C-methylase UbiE